MIRGTLASMIYTKALTLDSAIAAKDGSSSLTLMSTDVDRICVGFEEIQELWASPTQVVVGIWLLERQHGAACFVPAAITFVCTFLSFKLGKFMGPAQGVWVKSVQDRVAKTSAILANMKEVKLLGLSGRWASEIQASRDYELYLSKRFRKAIVWMNVNSNLPSVIAPVITFAVFILISNQSGDGLDVTKAFTSLTIISLILNPLAKFLSSIPRFGATLGCFARIQAFLLSESRDDHRLPYGALFNNTQIDYVGSEQALEHGIDLTRLPSQHAPGKRQEQEHDAMLIEVGSFGIKKGEAPIVRNITLRIPKATLTMIIGKVGSGKSTLLKALLGELHCSSGFVHKSAASVGYCDQ